MAMDAERRREPPELRLPLLDDAHRADDEGRADVAVLALGGEHRDRLHRLAQAHVVGQDRAGSEIAEQPEPAVTALLEREQVELHRRRGRERREAALATLEQVGQRSIELDRAELDARLVGLEPGDGPHEVDDAVASLAALQEAQGAFDLGAVQGMPAAADPDEWLLGGGELGELLVGEDVVADREPPVEPGELGRRQETARPDRRPARRPEVDAQPAARPKPGGGQRDRDIALLEPRDQLAQEAAHRLRLELRLGRLGRMELDAGVGEERRDLGQLPDQIAARVARTQERIHLVAAAPEERGGQAEGGIVLRLQPELEHDRVSLLRLRSGPLVEVQAESPRRRRPPSETGVDPAGHPTSQRLVPRVGRERRLGRGKAGEEQLRGGCAADAGLPGQPDAVRPEAVARDPVDEDRIEVVDGGIAVAVEGSRADLRAGQRRSGSAPSARSRRASRPRRRARRRSRARGRGARGPRRRRGGRARRSRRSSARCRRARARRAARPRAGRAPPRRSAARRSVSRRGRA